MLHKTELAMSQAELLPPPNRGRHVTRHVTQGNQLHFLVATSVVFTITLLLSSIVIYFLVTVEVKEVRTHVLEIERELDEVKRELDVNRRELDENRRELEENRRELDENRQELDENIRELDENWRELDENRRELKQSKAELEPYIQHPSSDTNENATEEAFSADDAIPDGDDGDSFDLSNNIQNLEDEKHGNAHARDGRILSRQAREAEPGRTRQDKANRGQHRNRPEESTETTTPGGEGGVARSSDKAPFQGIDAVHLYPVQHSNETMEEVGREGSVRVDCNDLVKHGTKIRCANMLFWEPDHHSINKSWVTYANGFLAIHKPGTYYVYAQVTHHDELGAWSFGIYKKHHTTQDVHVVSQCPGMEPHIHSFDGRVYPVIFQCYTARVVRLHGGDQIFMKNEYYEHGNRVVKIDRHVTFWGLIRLSDL